MLISSTSVFAETVDTTTQTTPTDTTITTEQTTVTPRAIDQKIADAIAGAYSITVTAQEIADLHATDVGYGEISKAYGFASLSGTMTASDVLGMKETMGWGEIAASLGLKVSDVTKSDKAKQNALNKASEGETTDDDATTSEAATTSKSNNGKNNGNNGNGGGKGNGNGGGNGGGKR